MTRTATLFAFVASVSLSAQTTPAPGRSVSITGCVAQVQRDGSLGPKASGTQATPETAATEANSPLPTDRYQLTDATPVADPGHPADKASAASATTDAKTAYALRGLEKELAKHLGHRVQITGALLPPLETKLPSRAAATAEGIGIVQVAAVKMMGTDCTVDAR
jgi:hypothetical protein